MSRMAEFLIRTKDRHDWPAIRKDRVADVLTPHGSCVAVAGWGDHRLRYDDKERVRWRTALTRIRVPGLRRDLLVAMAVSLSSTIAWAALDRKP